MKKLIVFLFVSSFALAQGGVQTNAALRSTGAPAAGATVRVCTSIATGTPCSPLASIYSDATLATSKANPMTADANGNYSYFAEPGLYKEQVTFGTSTKTSIIQVALDADNASTFSGSDGVAGSYVTSRDTGGSWTLKRYDNTNQYGPTKTPASNAYVGSALWIESHAGSNNADQFFGLSSFMLVGTTPANTSANHSDSKVAGYFFCRRDAGSLTSSGCTSINSNIDVVEDSAKGDFSIEADFNNGTGINYTTATTASKDGIGIFSGGSNRPRYALRTGSTLDSTNAWDVAALFGGWYTKGIVVKPALSAVGTIAIEAQAKGPAATSIATEQQSPYIALTANRWDDNASLSYFDMWKLRAETISHSAGTAGFPALYIYDANSNKIMRFVNNSGSSELLQVGGGSVIAQGQFAVTTFTTNPGIRVTPGDDLNSTQAAIAVTDAANGVNNGLITKAGKGQFNGGVQAGASGSTITDTRAIVQAVYDCGTTTTCANTTNLSERLVRGTVALATGTPSTAVVTGISPAFTSTSTFSCTCSPVGTSAAIAGAACAVSNTSASSITLTGPDTVTTVISYSCIGH